MFGAIVASRPVITELQTVAPNQFAFNIPANPPFSHLVVFLLPGQLLAEGAAAAIYIQIPPREDFRLLGAISNEKQSAIFKVNAPTATSAAENGVKDDVMLDDATLEPVTENNGGPNVVVGVSVEAAASIQAQLADLKSRLPQGNELVRVPPQPSNPIPAYVPAQPSPAVLKTFAQNLINNASNFLLSFASGPRGQENVPLKSFQEWCSKFEKRVQLDPEWLERQAVQGDI